MKTLAELQQEFSLTLKDDKIYVRLDGGDASTFFPLEENELKDCVLVTREEFVGLLSCEDQDELLTILDDWAKNK